MKLYICQAYHWWYLLMKQTFWPRQIGHDDCLAVDGRYHTLAILGKTAPPGRPCQRCCPWHWLWWWDSIVNSRWIYYKPWCIKRRWVVIMIINVVDDIIIIILHDDDDEQRTYVHSFLLYLLSSILATVFIVNIMQLLMHEISNNTNESQHRSISYYSTIIMSTMINKWYTKIWWNYYYYSLLSNNLMINYSAAIHTTATAIECWWETNHLVKFYHVVLWLLIGNSAMTLT